jgi:hypothetical protein
MGGDIHGEVGVATATTATSLTSNSAVTHALNDLAGHRVLALTSGALVSGTILSNTSGTNTVVTVDRWNTPGTNTVAGTPSNTTAYAWLDGGCPAKHIALSTNATAPSATDIALAGELNNASGGLNRAAATYSHTLGVTSYTLSNTFTANSNDGGSNTIQKIGVFNTPVSVTGIMVFETALTSPPTLVSGDTLTIQETVNI